jgi:hypothetical protein
MVYIYFDIEVDQILKVYRTQYLECKSVEIVGLSLLVF